MTQAQVSSQSLPRGGSALVQAQPPEEREYERRLAAIAARRRRVAELEAELALLRGALARFEALCHARVGDLLAELRRVTGAIADYERLLERRRAAATTNGEPAADDLPLDDEPGPFARRDDRAERARRARPPRPETARSVPRLPAAEAAEAKRLYLDLAKRCHPDYAKTDDERRRREALMQQINDAFRARDLTTLRALHRQAEADDPAFATRPVRERLAWALEELARLDTRIAALKAEFAALRGTEVHRLWRRHEAGAPVFEGIEDDLEARLAAEGRRLDGLIAAYRRLLDEHKPTAAGSA